MTENIRSHVGVPRFLLNRFANDRQQVAVFDVMRQKNYCASPAKIGVEKGYYDDQAEQLLSECEEAPFSNLLIKLDKTNKLYKKTRLLYEDKEIVLDFVKFQFMRAKTNLAAVNEYSVTAKVFGEYSHSDLLKITTLLSSNPILMIKQPWQILMLESKNKNLINSSLGLYFVPSLKSKTQNEIKYIVIPISKSEAICITHSMLEEYSHFFASARNAEELNKWCMIFERNLGNGFVFATNICDFQF